MFSQCRPSGVPTLGTVLIGSTGITHGLQPERYRAGCKDWQYTDFSAWESTMTMQKFGLINILVVVNIIVLTSSDLVGTKRDMNLQNYF